MTKESENLDKRILVICPTGSAESKKRSDQLMQHVIIPAAEKLGLSEEAVVRLDKIAEPGKINLQLMKELIEASVVIADLSGVNPDIMYKVGIRQALLKPIVLVAKKEQKLPFDLDGLRTIYYQLDLENISTAKKALIANLKSSLEGTVSELDKAMFSHRDTDSDISSTDNAMLDVYGLLEAMHNQNAETKELIRGVSYMLAERFTQEAQFRQERSTQDQVNQEMVTNMQEMQKHFMNQFMKNPESMNKMNSLMSEFFKMFSSDPKKNEDSGSDSDSDDSK